MQHRKTQTSFLLGGVIWFWGWQSHLLFLAIPMAILLESAPWVSWRFALSDKEFQRITHLVSTLATLTFLILLSKSIYGFTTFITWLPLLFFPLLMAQIYSTEGTIRVSNLFLSLQKIEPKKSLLPFPRVDLTFPYMMGCLISASTHRTEWFFPMVCLLVTVGLWTIRPQRYAVYTWGTLLTVTLGIAYIGHLGLYTLQTYVEGRLLEWFENFLWLERDPYRQNTSIGDIKHLKQSNHIRLRVQSPLPIKLREASYNSYYRGTWRAKRADFTPLSPQRDGTSWHLSSFPVPKEQNSHIQISTFLQRGQGILPLPLGTYQITQLPASTVQNNRFGAVKVEQSPGLIQYTAHANSTHSLDAPPNDQDLYLLSEDQAIFDKLATTLNLYSQPPHQILTTVTHFFNRHFQYSLDLTLPKEESLKINKIDMPLEKFLYQTQAGHCEYFATATVLLLRTVGIPARYTVGYVVEEFSELENAYIVRQRHAHAWSLAYLEGHWQELDTTPSNWLELEEKNLSHWQMIDDIWSWLTYKFSKWSWQERDIHSYYRLLWILLPLSIGFAWRLYQPGKIRRLPKWNTNPNKLNGLESQSPFYPIIQYLLTKGYQPLPGEPLTFWLTRLHHLPASEKIPTMLNLHLRYRFDPIGISVQERTQLANLVSAWLQSTMISKGNPREFD